MHATFDLRTRSPQLESDGTILNRLLQLLDVLDTHVLEGVLQTGVQVRQEQADRAFVLDVAGHTLRHFHS